MFTRPDGKTLRQAQGKTLLWFFGGLLAFAVILIAGTNVILKSVPTEQPATNTSLPPLDRTHENQPPKGGTQYNITDANVTDPRAIIYTNAGFALSTTTIKASDPVGCVITVENHSNRTIRVGVNPHRDAGDPGADYGELAPGAVGIYDVRYPGFSEISLHNHFQAAHGFTVIYGEGCRP